MDKKKVRGIQLSDNIRVSYFTNCGNLSMTVDCVYGNCIITENELLSYLQFRNSLKFVERNDSGGVDAKPDSQQPQERHYSDIISRIESGELQPPFINRFPES